MVKLIPVPWLRWQRFRVSGVICEEESGRPLAGLHVQAFDKDVVSDDFLGDGSTNAEGRFEIRFTDADFKDAVEAQPDIYLRVYSPDASEPIYDTSHSIRRNADSEEYYEIRIPSESVPQVSK